MGEGRVILPSWTEPPFLPLSLSSQGFPKDPNIVFFTCISGDGARRGKETNLFLSSRRQIPQHQLLGITSEKHEKKRFSCLLRFGNDTRPGMLRH